MILNRNFAFTIFTALAVTMSTSTAHAGGPEFDGWSFEAHQYMRPHQNNCDASTESFLVTIPSESRGFCVEQNTRTAAHARVARADCANSGKRLPEPNEFQMMCELANAGTFTLFGYQHSGAVLGEWFGNVPYMQESTVTPGEIGLFQPAGGYVNGPVTCDQLSHYEVQTSNAFPQYTFPYRCMR